MAAQGAAYLPVWLVTPKAWAQTDLDRPRFDGSGLLQLSQLKKRSAQARGL
jgi:peptide/nickel transport system substrate-binding protein